MAYPTPPSVSVNTSLRYPSDLNTNNGYYISLQIAQYTRPGVYSSPIIIPQYTITLPVPIKLNDQTTVVWEQSSLAELGQEALNAGLGLAGLFTQVNAINQVVNSVLGAGATANKIAGYTTGYTANPFLIMLFKNANFKVHNLDWIFAPNSLSDTNNLDAIIKVLKNSMLPTQDGLAMQYPYIIQPQLSMQGQTYAFKYCAIESIAVDWSAGPVPSFFGSTGAPSLVSMNMQLREIELWYNGQV